MLTFSSRHFVIFLILFFTEAAIAAFVHDALIRPFFGDFLAVIGVYFFLKSFLRISNSTAAWVSIAFAYFLELLQYCNFIAYAGLEKYRILTIMLGTSYDWRDLLAYTLGILALVFFNKYFQPATIKEA